VNGTKVYIQAILDNASRYVLAWQVTQDYGGANTKALIEKALEVANRISGNVGIPNLFADDRRKRPWCDGTENQNKDVDSLVKAGIGRSPPAAPDAKSKKSGPQKFGYASPKEIQQVLTTMRSPAPVRQFPLRTEGPWKEPRPIPRSRFSVTTEGRPFDFCHTAKNCPPAEKESFRNRKQEST
jgi:hypothetical protein